MSQKKKKKKRKQEKGFPKRKSMEFNTNRKFNVKLLNETNSVKYIGIRLIANLFGKLILTILHLN